MTIPFYTLNIHEPLQQMLYDADDSGEWGFIIAYCEPLIGTTDDDGVILCYTFALMEEAMAIHVDDVEATAIRCLDLLKKLKHTYGGTDHWKRMIKREIKNAKAFKQYDKTLLKIPYDNLTAKEKSKLAYNLAQKGGIENFKKAADMYKELIELNKDNHDESYHYGNYIMNLYRSNQLTIANGKFDEFLNWITHTEKQSYSFLVGMCFQEKIIHYKNDVVQFEKIWSDAINNVAVKRESAFPIAEAVQDELLMIATELGSIAIKKYLIDLIKSERKPRMIPNHIKKIIEN
jgi:tetratricopeptide (TPR) repeat protein